MKLNKPISLTVILVGYLVTLFACYLIYPFFSHHHPILTALILDVIATVIIFGFSMVFNNSSFYDPYWSVAPIPIVVFWAWLMGEDGGNSIRLALIFALVLIWGGRLTLNWIQRWKGMKDEDWRYADFRKKFKGLYWVISFLGIHMFPTLIVFLGLLALYPALVLSDEPIGIMDIIAFLITLVAIAIETVSDKQLREYLKKEDRKPFLDTGIWKYSRHPNYFGEVLCWFGFFLFSAGLETFYWWTLAGPLAMIFLFAFISVPMMDRRMLKRKEGYGEYMKKTPGFLLRKPK